MRLGKGWRSWGARGGPVLWAGLLVGCATGGGHVDQALLADRGSAARNEGVAERYTVGCPDVLEVAVPDRPDLSGRRTVGPDGRIDLGALGQVRVEGRTVPQITYWVGQQVGLPPGQVRVRVAEFKSQQIYLFGQVVGKQRSVPYQGQETVLDLLHRAGGVMPGAAPEDVYVVRARVAEGQRPEVFHIDLRAILSGKDPSTNVRLQPFDQVYVGETRTARLGKCLPPVLRPVYEAVCGLRPSSPPEGPAPAPRKKADRAVVQVPALTSRGVAP
jgi:protein involved in polysaccharide export with SLBB domain